METATIKQALKSVLNGRGLYWYGNRRKPCVALTFDDGPDRFVTPEILNLLQAYKFHATFFLVGRNIMANADLVRRMIREGHEVGNHTFSHLELGAANWRRIRADIVQTDQLLAAHFNLSPTYLRLPKGSWNLLIIPILFVLRKTLVFWNVDPRDFAANSSREIVASIRRTGIRGGDILLLHDRCPLTVEALSDILRQLQTCGLRGCRLSEVLH